MSARSASLERFFFEPDPVAGAARVFLDAFVLYHVGPAVPPDKGRHGNPLADARDDVDHPLKILFGRRIARCTGMPHAGLPTAPRQNVPELADTASCEVMP
jgi:hypothetical protein